MCGIACYISKNELYPHKRASLLDLMKNRGPDAQAEVSWKIGEYNIYFFHSRLAIIDLDPRSNQPFQIGTHTIIFNGEIYNYKEIKDELLKNGTNFKTDSDTEVLLYAYINWGEDAFKKCEGMWSCIIFDSKSGQLALSRDRFGEKPLFYSEKNGEYILGSEIKFIKALSSKKIEVDIEKLLSFVAFGHRTIHTDNSTFYKKIKNFPAGHCGYLIPGEAIKSTSYWKQSYNIVTSNSIEENIERIKTSLERAVKLRMRSDVPIAFCLSSGIDSSALCAYAAKKLNANVAAFSIIDSDPRYNELEGIKNIVNYLSIEHTPIFLEKGDFLQKLKSIIGYHSLPLPTISYYVHALLSESIASKGYKVVISGTGADELFTGYYEHFLFHLAEVKGKDSYAEHYDNWIKFVSPLIRNKSLLDTEICSQNSDLNVHRYQGKAYKDFFKKLNIKIPSEIRYSDYPLRNRLINEMFHEIIPVILESDDLNSMRVSIENRSPFLDSDLFNLCMHIQPEQMIQNGYTKFLLRSAISDLLPESIVWNRNKIGFNASITSLADLKDKDFREYLLTNSEISDFLDMDKIISLCNKDSLTDDENKFLFSYLSSRVFLDTQ